MIFLENYTNEQPSSMCVDWAIDFEKGCMKLRSAKPYLVYGSEALEVFIYKAIKTRKDVFSAYENGFGCESLTCDGEGVIKQRITQALEHPDIKSVHSFEFSREAEMVHIGFCVDSTYGNISTQISEEVAV